MISYIFILLIILSEVSTEIKSNHGKREINETDEDARNSAEMMSVIDRLKIIPIKTSALTLE